MVVEPVGRARIAVQSGDMSAEPDTGIGKVVGVACLRVRTVLIDWRRPIDGVCGQDGRRVAWKLCVRAGFRLRLGGHKYDLQSSILGLRCRRGNHKNAAGCELTVWFLDGHGVSDAAWLYCNSTSFNFSYRNTGRHGNCPRAILIAYNESRAAARLQDAIGHARTRSGGWLPRNGP